MNKLHTHYDNLKVTRNAPVEVIRAAYRAMAQKYHPDLNSSPAASNTMKILNEAWEVLSDPKKRAAHDKWILEEEDKQIKEPPNNSKEQVFENNNFRFRFETLTKDHFFIRRNQKPKAYYENFTAPKSPESKLAILNTWLGRKTVQLKAIAFIATAFLVFLLWMSIESHRKQKIIDETNATAASATSEKSNDWQVVEEKPFTFVPITELPKSNSKKNEKAPDFSNFGTSVQSESKRVVDAEKQKRTGYVKGAYQEAPAGLSNFTVDNQRGGSDAIARVYHNGKKPASRSMYVKAGEKFTAHGLPPGNYVFRYRFIGSNKTYEADRLFPLQETITDEGTRFSNVTVTLFTVSDGNLQTREVPDDKF